MGLDPRPILPRHAPVVGARPVWTDRDYRELANTAAAVGARPEDLLLVLYAESGLDPHAANRDAKGYPIAVGLNQITGVNAQAMGLTEAERLALLELTVFEQLPYVAGSLLTAAGARTYRDAGEIHLANFAPAKLGAPGSTPDDGLALYAEGSAAYAHNKALDLDHDGVISLGDLRTWLRQRAGHGAFRAALAELAATVPGVGAPYVGNAPVGSAPTPKDPPAAQPPPASSSSDGGGVGVAAVAAVGLYALWRVLA